MKAFRFLSMALIGMVVGNQACAETESVFGVPLGQAFLLPECAKLSYGYAPVTNSTCFKKREAKEPIPVVNGSVIIMFPIVETPEIVKGGELAGRIVDGNLEGIGFNTMGARDADIVFSKLKDKYGEPKAVIPRIVKNRIGASFDAFDAIWIRGNGEVVFQSVSGSLDSGLVSIETRKGGDARVRDMNALMKNKRPL